jgi:hypothetical protein
LKEVSKPTFNLNERPLSVRRRKADLIRRVNGELRVEFTETGLTSHAGLELFIRYFRTIGLNQMIRWHLGGASLASDFGAVAMVRVLLGLLIVGGKRLRHVEFLRGDPLVHRFCGLADLPRIQTISRWLKRFQERSVERLRRMNAEIVAEVVRPLSIRTLTCDVDGSVLSTGLTVERAFRGYNPHHRKVPSYYPITAYLAETGHILRVKNRSGNIEDGAASIPFLRDVFRQVRETLGPGYRLNFRMDGAFFRQTVLRLLAAQGAGYAIKVPFYEWLGLKQLVGDRRRWQRIDGKVGAFETQLDLAPWGLRVRVVVFRKKVFHKSRKNYQLDLFDPDDGYWEYSAVATNLAFDPRRLWNFMCGRGAHEKAIGELKSGLAFATIPTHHYGANSAWQQLVVLAHNLLTNFQIETGAETRPRSQKRTALRVLRRIKTLRFEIINRAGQISRPGGTTVLRLQRNERARDLFIRTAQALARAA